MTSVSAIASACRAGALFLSAAGCVAPGGYYDGYYDSGAGSSGGYSSSGETSSSSSSGGYSGYGDGGESSRVTPDGDIVFRERGETTVVSPNGDVTVTERDRDGTRTIVGSDGSVRVETPDGNCIGDC